MKITIGDMTIEANDADEAVAIVTALLERTNKVDPGEARQRLDMVQPAPADNNGKRLSPALAEIYEYLVDNDSPEGITRKDLAEAFGIKVAAMDQRLRQLRKRGLASQSSRGYWRHGAA
jgi:DNA-binding MarR family transcriptional regulator